MNFEENNFILEPTGKIKQISGLPKEITAIVKQETGYDTIPVYIPHPEGKESFLNLNSPLLAAWDESEI